MEEIRIRYENNLKIRNAIDKQSAKLLELERNWTQVREISDTVNGKSDTFCCACWSARGHCHNVIVDHKSFFQDKDKNNT